MKRKVFAFFVCLTVASFVYAQNVLYQDTGFSNFNKEDFRLVDLFEYDVEGQKSDGGNYLAKLKVNVTFDFQQSTFISFKDSEGMISFRTDFKWPLKRGDSVTIYFTAEHKVYGDSGFWREPNLVYAETFVENNSKPWDKYISNDKSFLNGWYLESLGNGLYREHFYENGRIVEEKSDKMEIPEISDLDKYLSEEDLKELEDIDETEIYEAMESFSELSEDVKEGLMFLLLLYLLSGRK